MIRVLIVDDSAFMRTALSKVLERAPDIRVVGTARDGQEALDLVDALDPDVVTMDIEMPRMDGLTALRHLMKRSPRPVLMISSLTQEGTAATVEALSVGAIDFISKERARLSVTQGEGELHRKVKTAALARRRLALRRLPEGSASTRSDVAAPPLRTIRRQPQAEVLVIGVSTGGPFALQELIPALPATLPVPVLIVQHMPPRFTRSLAERLDAHSALTVREAEHGMRLEPGLALVARGGTHLSLRRAPHDGSVRAILSPEPSDVLHRPSADVLFRAAADVYGPHTLALVMTGMGKDGLEGATYIRAQGGSVLAQDEASCVVYGMPRAVVEAGIAEAALPLARLAETLTRTLDRPAHRVAASL